ncbi:MAG: ISAs1 family transposase [Chitinophagaceae bacterium]
MASIIDHFSSLRDPRTKEHKKEHKLIDILFITIAAVICGAEDWNDIEFYGHEKEEWLRTILALPSGIPSHDTFNRVFSLIDPVELQNCFISWVQSIAQISEGQIISIDGKRMRNSGEGGKKAVIHMVSAWSKENSMVLGQVKVNDKSNEITAIPALLDLLMVQGCWITIDAMGCQKDIAAKIKSKGAEYILAVKDNQEHLHDDLKDAFTHGMAEQVDEQINLGHGRIEKRTCRTITATDWVCKYEDWQGLQTLIEIQSERTIKATGVKEIQTRHYISSALATAKRFNEAVRGHWEIENNLHWLLDVAFNEDNSMKRAGNAAENFSVITKIALNAIKQSELKKGATKISIKSKRKKAGWNNGYLTKILTDSH